MDLELRGKTAVVTGGSAGIGKAIALGLAAEGVSVGICARRPEPLRETETALRARGVDAYAAPCDIADPAALDAFLEDVKRRFGRVDVLVNNASGFGNADDEAGWAASIEVDLLASARAARKVTPWMVESGGGVILFISSVSGLEAGWGRPYSAAKAAQISYAKSLAFDLAKDKIRVNTIAPGSIGFEGGRWEKVRLNNPARYQAVVDSVPWGRLGTAEEVADVAVFLASRRASWITGSCILVDGGQHRDNL